MEFSTKRLEQALVGKFGFQQSMTHEQGHKWYELTLPGLPTIRTKLSHGTSSYGDVLLSKMAKQLHVRRPFFNEMISCTKGRAEYYEQICIDPYPPWVA